MSADPRTTTTTRPDAGYDTRRAHVHGMWTAVAPHWADHADFVDERVAALTTTLLERAELQPGDAVLELACGPGGAGLAAAERVGPAGTVALTDVVAEMVAIAAARAEARGTTNVHTAVRDLEAIDDPNGTYDAVICREGLMFAVAPERAAQEVYRVLRPGGRVAASVWGRRDRNPWLGVVFDAVTAETGFPVPPPGLPGPFALSDPSQLAGLLTAAGFADVRIEEVAVSLRAPSFEWWWTRTASVAGPLATILAGLPAPARDALTGRLRAAVAGYITSAGLELPGVALVASGRVPADGRVPAGARPSIG
jgi:ubiquinone/menaquinone biosynthesis C-methylase UbiE